MKLGFISFSTSARVSPETANVNCEEIDQRTSSVAKKTLSGTHSTAPSLETNRFQNWSLAGIFSYIGRIFSSIMPSCLNRNTSTDDINRIFTESNATDSLVDPKCSEIERSIMDDNTLPDIKTKVLDQVYNDWSRLSEKSLKHYIVNGVYYGMHNVVGTQDKKDKLRQQIDGVYDEIFEFLNKNLKDQPEDTKRLIALYIMSNLHQGALKTFQEHALIMSSKIVDKQGQPSITTEINNYTFDLKIKNDRISLSKSCMLEIHDLEAQKNTPSYSKTKPRPLKCFEMSSHCDDLAAKLLGYIKKRQPIQLTKPTSDDSFSFTQEYDIDQGTIESQSEKISVKVYNYATNPKKTIANALIENISYDDYADPENSNISYGLDQKHKSLDVITTETLEQLETDLLRITKESDGTLTRILTVNGHSYGKFTITKGLEEETEEAIKAQAKEIHTKIFDFVKKIKPDISDEKRQLITLYIIENLYQTGSSRLNGHAMETAQALDPNLLVSGNNFCQAELILDEDNSCISLTKTFVGEIVTSNTIDIRQRIKDNTYDSHPVANIRKYEGDYKPEVIFKVESRCDDLVKKLLSYLNIKAESTEEMQLVDKCVDAFVSDTTLQKLKGLPEEEYEKVENEILDDLSNKFSEIDDKTTKDIEAQRGPLIITIIEAN